ncbi:hypothetical protein RB195_006956 [Necator americanus]|uniref:Endonuclease/exonuclease/phosphatase domain-containing protein n=1 Tax=Necator americanus TaxID=51031 RepID=A0ABR1BYL7_NECAM
MAVKLDTGEVELRVVSAYAPQVGSSKEEKACFWEDLEQYAQSLEGEEVLLIEGDFNGHVGSRKDGFESCHGGCGYGARSDNGLRIPEYAVASDLIIANTQYRKRTSHSITYTSGGRETQIDFWMLRRRDRRLLQDSKVIPTDHVAAQHHLLVMDLKISRATKRHPRIETQRIKWWNLKNRKEVFFASVAPSTVFHPTRSVEEMWSSTSSVIRLTAENTLGKTTLGKPKKQVQSWKDQLQKYGLRLNTSKTEYMECGPRIEDGSIRVDGTELNKVNCFKYLGSKVTSTGDIDQEGRARVNAAWMKWKMATGHGCASCCPLRMRMLADDESLGKSVTRYGDADVKVDNRCNAKRETLSNDTVRSIFGVVPITEKMKEARLR